MRILGLDVKKFLQVIVIALAFVLASAPAWALGLGQIQVKSRLNEPFLAYIPIISSDPAELQELSAKLADPETFIRVGLPLPDRLVSDLHFSIETGEDGKPFVKVTSLTPVTLTELDFLVEVQWSDGRLVREYSALMTPPNTIAGTPPAIQAPTVAPNNAVVRAESTVTEALPEQTTTPSVATSAAPVSSVADTASAPESSSASSVVASGRTYGPIRYGQTLGEIARAMAGNNGDPTQTMQQLLQLNSDAFIGGNINRLKAGAILRTPEGSLDVKAPSAEDRAAVAKAAPSVANRTVRPTDTSTVANKAANESRTSASAAPKALSEARLKIVAPTANNDAPTTRSGGGKQGDGDMLQQQIQQANESIATKDAEINELKSRVAELEQLKNKQAQLIAIKDTQLASAQKNLQTRQTEKGKDAAGANHFPWMGLTWALIAAVLLAGLVWVFRGRKKSSAKPAGTPRWMQDLAAASAVSEAAYAAEAKTADANVEPSHEPVPVPKADPISEDHDALSKIAKARACIVVGDKHAAREILQTLLQESLLPETHKAAEQLLNDLR